MFFKSTWPLRSQGASMGGWWCLQGFHSWNSRRNWYFWVGTKFGTSEQTEEKPCFFLQIQLQGGAPYYIHGVMWITPRNGRKENNIKLFHPYKWHSLLTTGFWGPACRHLHKTFQQYTPNKNNKFKKIMLMPKDFDSFKVDLKRCFFYCKFIYLVIIFVRSLRL